MNSLIVEEIKKIIITDLSNYVSETSSDGGNYSFTISYELVGYSDKLEKHLYKKSYATSSVFEYCSCCGSFGDSESHSLCINDIVFIEDVMEDIKKNENKDDYLIRYHRNMEMVNHNMVNPFEGK